MKQMMVFLMIVSLLFLFGCDKEEQYNECVDDCYNSCFVDELFYQYKYIDDLKDDFNISVSEEWEINRIERKRDSCINFCGIHCSYE